MANYVNYALFVMSAHMAAKIWPNITFELKAGTVPFQQYSRLSATNNIP